MITSEQREICTLQLNKLVLFPVILAVLAAFCISCSKKPESSQHKIVDSGAWTRLSGDKTVWLDNDHVVFVSNKTLSPGPDPKFLAIWNTSTGKVDVSHEVTGLVCGRNGQVMFAAKDKTTGMPKHYRGSLENPKEYPMPNPEMRMDSIYDCDWVPKNSCAQTPYKLKLRGNNYLEILEGKPDLSGTPQERLKVKRPMSNKPVTQEQHGGPVLHDLMYYEKPDGKPVTLPFQLGGWNGYEVSYIERLDSYLVSPDQYYVDKPIQIWWLERNGTVRKEPLPDSLRFPYAGVISFHPVKGGILVDYGGGSLSGDAGGYLVHDGKVTRITKQPISAVSVSPDGCIIAFEHARNTKEYYSSQKPYRTLKFINLCEGGKKQ